MLNHIIRKFYSITIFVCTSKLYIKNYFNYIFKDPKQKYPVQIVAYKHLLNTINTVELTKETKFLRFSIYSLLQ